MSVTRTCGHCGEPFTVRAPSRRGKYCDSRCAGLARSASFAQEPDPYEIEWAEAYDDRRVERTRPIVSALPRCIRAGDAKGVQKLWNLVNAPDGDPPAIFIALGARIAELEDALQGERSTDEEGRAA